MPRESNDAHDESGASSDKVRRRRCRAPLPVILSLRTDLQPNHHHPLAGLAPDVRGQQREELISSILARLAAGRSTSPISIGRIEGLARTNDSSTPPLPE